MQRSQFVGVPVFDEVPSFAPAPVPQSASPRIAPAPAPARQLAPAIAAEAHPDDGGTESPKDMATSSFQYQEIQHPPAQSGAASVPFEQQHDPSTLNLGYRTSSSAQAPTGVGAGGAVPFPGHSSAYGYGGFYSDAGPPAYQPQPSGGRGSVASSVAFCPCGTLNGNTIKLFGDDRARSFPWICMVGPDWPCLIVTYSLVVGPSVAFLAMVAPTIHPAIAGAGAGLAMLTVVMLSLTACSNPGYLRRQSPAELADARRLAEEDGRAGQVTVCQYCNVLREARTSHCYECNACVLELDHHCPWTGKCIGKHNLRYFYGFISCLFGLVLFVAGSVFAFAVGRAVPR